jgi:hypothetical protein
MSANFTANANPARRPIHTRQIVCNGYARDDGLYDIEARMTDTKAHHSDLLFKEVPAGGAIHDMWLTITVDTDLVIRDAHSRTETAPTPYCAEINDAYRKLIGVQISSGFMREIRARVGGTKGCTHLTELLGPMATTAFQTIMGLRNSPSASRSSDGAQALPMLNGCHAWRADGEVVQFVRRRAA